MLVVGTPGFQDGVRIPVASLLDFYSPDYIFLIFQMLGPKIRREVEDNSIKLCLCVYMRT